MPHLGGRVTACTSDLSVTKSILSKCRHPADFLTEPVLGLRGAWSGGGGCGAKPSPFKTCTGPSRLARKAQGGGPGSILSPGVPPDL